MLVIETRNPHMGLLTAMDILNAHGIREPSRNGDVLRIPCPVTTVIRKPMERVVFHEWRDANPFFHLVESLWMLGGRDDLKQLTPYVKRMADFSDDGGITQPAAYGKRWRDWMWFGVDEEFDQLNWAVKRLRVDKNDRRVVIQMWDPYVDIHAVDDGGKDVPCNLTMLPWVQDGALHLTVFNRSHDIIWGLFGANCVHFSVVLEYLAGRIGLGVGTLTFISNNFHAYLNTMPDRKNYHHGPDPYSNRNVEPYSLFSDFELSSILFFGHHSESTCERMMQEDLRIFFEHGPFEAATKARWPFLRQVAVPLAMAHQHWKKNRGLDRYTGALEILEQCQATDWHMAAQQWIKRRETKFLKAQDDGVKHDHVD